MKKNAANPKPQDNKAESFNRQLKLVTGKLADLSEHSKEGLTLLQGKKVVWASPKKAAPKAVQKKAPGAGRPEKTELKTSVDELQAMRNAKALRSRAQLENKKKPAAQKKKAAPARESAAKGFSVSRQPTVTKKKKRA